MTTINNQTKPLFIQTRDYINSTNTKNKEFFCRLLNIVGYAEFVDLQHIMTFPLGVLFWRESRKIRIISLLRETTRTRTRKSPGRRAGSGRRWTSPAGAA